MKIRNVNVDNKMILPLWTDLYSKFVIKILKENHSRHSPNISIGNLK